MNAALALVLCAVAVLTWPAGRTAASRPHARAAFAPGRLRDRPLGRRTRVGIAVTAVLATAIVAPPHAALCAGVLLLVLLSTWEQGRGRRRAVAELARDSDVLQGLAAELRAGHDLSVAMRSTAEDETTALGGALRRAGHAVRMGEDPADALDRAAPGAVGRRLAGLVRLSGSHGVALADAVDVLAGEVADELRQRRDLAGLLAGPRATSSLLALLPVFGIVMGESIGAHPLHTLLRTGTGAIVMVAGVALAATGVVWTQALVRRAEP